MSNFDFLTSEWKDIHEAASKAESAAIPDPRTVHQVTPERQNLRKTTIFALFIQNAGEPTA